MATAVCRAATAADAATRSDTGMTRPRILLANEFGAGRGHLVTLRQLARAFGDGFVFDAALCRRQHDDIMQSIGAYIYDGPRLIYRNARRTGPDAVRTSTWGEFLGDLGFSREARIAEIVAWWRHVIQSRQIAMVIADYAPLALLAARSLNVPSLATGTGYGLPPWQMTAFPMLRPENNIRLHDEAEMLAHVNRVATRHGLPPLRGLPEVYRASCTLVRTLPFLDPYRPWRVDGYLPPVTDVGPVVASEGREVFLYFSTTEMEDPQVVDAVARLPLPRRGYLPGAPAGVAARLASSGMIVETAPVPVADIARRSRLVVNAGQHGILALGLYAGLPQVCLPQHLEQAWHARAAETGGVARVIDAQSRSSDAIMATISAVYHDDAMFAQAGQMARDLRAGLDAHPDEITARTIAPLIAALRGDPADRPS